MPLDICNATQTYSHQTVRRFQSIQLVASRADFVADHPYVLAFSLIMLHTDAFNKSNKRKMTKPDYIKNTRLPGVPSEVLDVSGHPSFNYVSLTKSVNSAFMTISYSLPSFSSRIPWTLMASGVSHHLTQHPVAYPRITRLLRVASVPPARHFSEKETRLIHIS